MTSQEESVLYRIRPVMVVPLWVCAGILVALAVLLLSSDHARTPKALFAEAGYLWVSIAMVRWVLTMPIRVRVGPGGLAVRSVLGWRRCGWERIASIAWHEENTTLEFPGKIILVESRGRVHGFNSRSFARREPPMLATFERVWSGKPILQLPRTVAPPVGARRILWVCLHVTFICVALLAFLHLTGLTRHGWTIRQILLYSAAPLGVALALMFQARVVSHTRGVGYHKALTVARQRAEAEPIRAVLLNDDGTAATVEPDDDPPPPAPRTFRARLSPFPAAQRFGARQMASLEPRMREIDNCGNRVLLTLWVLFGAAVAAGLIYMHRWMDGPTVEPVLDTTGIRWGFAVAAGFFLGMLPAFPLTVRTVRKRFGKEVDTYLRYRSTRQGYDIAKWEGTLMPAMLLLCGAVMALPAWTSGDVIDRNGIRSCPGLYACYEHPYDEVRSIEIYKRVDAPLGLRRQPNLRITFTDGPPLTHMPQNDTPISNRWMTVVTYVSERSGVPITRGDIRPD